MRIEDVWVVVVEGNGLRGGEPVRRYVAKGGGVTDKLVAAKLFCSFDLANREAVGIRGEIGGWSYVYAELKETIPAAPIIARDERLEEIVSDGVVRYHAAAEAICDTAVDPVDPLERLMRAGLFTLSQRWASRSDLDEFWDVIDCGGSDLVTSRVAALLNYESFLFGGGSDFDDGVDVWQIDEPTRFDSVDYGRSAESRDDDGLCM